MEKLLICFTIVLGLLSGNTRGQQLSDEFEKNKNKTILAIFAHPDDEGYVTPIFAKYAKLGVNIQLVVVTDGSKGVTAHANIEAGDALTKVRKLETDCAAKTLGINPPVFLGYTDGTLASMGSMATLDDKIDSLFVKLRPDVVITFGPDGAYGHPDHRTVSNLVTEVYQKQGLASSNQLLYVGFSAESMNQITGLKTATGKWFKENIHTTDMKYLTYRVPYSKENYELARNSFYCHESQFTREEMDDLWLLLGTERYVYFRPWNGSAKIHDDVFE